MTQQQTPVGWYPDPTGRHESRYFNGQWTQQVSTQGVNSIDPLTASPPPATSAQVSTSVHTPYGPTGQTGPGTPPPYLQSAPRTSWRSPKVKLAIAGGVVAVAVGITLAVTLSGGSSGGHGLCTDARALYARYGSLPAMKADLSKNRSEVSYVADQFDLLAAESPSPQNAADLRLVAGAFRDLYNGNYVAFQAEQARVNAAANRAKAYLTDQCG
ncbi:MAG TPA: DUF2510 domain-containing protein [Jatrophihabitans sp.]|nr:DUF2510 domain-containing protein [Jatrophihabitans sp.]